MERSVQVLCMIHKHPYILLGMKKRGFGKGRWNGFGGKVKEGETVDDAVCRELKEESGLDAIHLQKHGIIEFEFPHDDFLIEGHIYRCEHYEGELIESDEMIPKWFHVNELPFESMWQDDQHWINYLLDEKFFKARFVFDEGDNILEKHVELVDSL
ncbi:MAG: 8-oxo-dGTP diphosphatase [Patescibacteria group bacterium]